MFKFFFLLFLLIPLIELFLLLQVGQIIGVGWTVFLVVATAVIGTFLLRQQGLQTLQRARETMQRGQLPTVEMLEGVCLLFSGALLITPGLVTDVIGFLLLISPLRQWWISNLLKRTRFISGIGRSDFYFQSRHSSSRKEDIIEGKVIDDDEPRPLH